MNNKKIQLFCLPFAGGSKTVFNKFEKCLNSKIETVLIEYPGHDSRRNEDFCSNIDEIVMDACRQIRGKRKKNLPYALLGYSMGSVIAYELLCRICRSQTKFYGEPVHVFFCAIEALSEFKPRIYFDKMDQKDIIDILKNMGGIEEAVFSDKRFLEVFLRPVRADYKILADYALDDKNEILPNVDCSVLFSAKDIPFVRVKGWQELVSGNVEFHELGNNHFFIKDCFKNMAELVSKKLI